MDSDIEALHRADALAAAGAEAPLDVVEVDPLSDVAAPLEQDFLPRSPAQWRSLTHVFTRLDDVAVVRVRGRDAVKVLHSLTAQHLPAFLAEAWEAQQAALTRAPSPAAGHDATAASVAREGVAAAGVRVVASAACFAAWLTPKGRYLFDTVIEVETFPDNMADAAAAHRQQHEQPSRYKQPTQEAANALQGASLLVHVPRARAAELARHIRASALRIRADIAVDSELAVWAAAVRETAAEDAVARGILAGALAEQDEAAEAAEEAAEEAAANAAAAGQSAAPASHITEPAQEGERVYRVFVDPRLGQRGAGASAGPGAVLQSFTFVPDAATAAAAAAAQTEVQTRAQSHADAPSPRQELLPAGELTLVRVVGPASAPPPLAPPFVSVHRSVYEVARTVLGLPESGRELAAEKTLPLEANLDLLHGVHFHKGCYLGQELTTRTHFQGLVRKRVLPVFLRPLDTAAATAAAAAETAVALPGLRANEPAALVAAAEAEAETAPGTEAESALFPWAFLEPFALPAQSESPSESAHMVTQASSQQSQPSRSSQPPRSPAALAASLGLEPGSPLWTAFTAQFDAAPHANTIAGYTPPAVAVVAGDAALAASAGTTAAGRFAAVTAGAPAEGVGLLMTTEFGTVTGNAAAAEKMGADKTAPRTAEVGKLLSLPRVRLLTAAEAEAETETAEATQSAEAATNPAVVNVGFAMVRMAEVEAPFGRIVVTGGAGDTVRSGETETVAPLPDRVWEVVPLCPQWLAREMDRIDRAK